MGDGSHGSGGGDKSRANLVPQRVVIGHQESDEHAND